MSYMAQSPRPFFIRNPWPVGPDYNDGSESPPSAVPHKSSYDLNSKILLTAIISLSFVVAVVTVLHLYARFVLRRRARRRAVIRRLTLNAAGSTGEPPASGLDSTAIASLPIFAYKKPPDGQDDAASTECAVCLNLLEEEEMVRVLPNCRHTFHAECIDRWLSSRSTCPICRTEAEPRIQPEPREGPAAATAAPLERVSVEGTSSSSLDGGGQSGAKVSGPSTPRLSSFRRMLGRERSSRRLQIEVQDGVEDLERQ